MSAHDWRCAEQCAADGYRAVIVPADGTSEFGIGVFETIGWARQRLADWRYQFPGSAREALVVSASHRQHVYARMESQTTSR